MANITLYEGTDNAATPNYITAERTVRRSGTANFSEIGRYEYFYLPGSAGTRSMVHQTRIVGSNIGSGSAWAGAYYLTTYGSSTNCTLYVSNSSVAAYNTSGNNIFSVDSTRFLPGLDATQTLGISTQRWTIVYATTGTINTSDINQKEQIENLDAAELNVAIQLKGLIKKYKWKDAVAKKGDKARTHVGVIAQEVEALFIAQGLDPNKYALFCRDIWWEREEDNPHYLLYWKRREPNPKAGTSLNEPLEIDVEYDHEVEGAQRIESGGKPRIICTYTTEVENSIYRTQLGIRYDQLLAFIIAAM